MPLRCCLATHQCLTPHRTASASWPTARHSPFQNQDPRVYHTRPEPGGPAACCWRSPGVEIVFRRPYGRASTHGAPCSHSKEYSWIIEQLGVTVNSKRNGSFAPHRSPRSPFTAYRSLFTAFTSPTGCTRSTGPGRCTRRLASAGGAALRSDRCLVPDSPR